MRKRVATLAALLAFALAAVPLSARAAPRTALDRTSRGRLPQSQRAASGDVPRGVARHEQARAVRARRNRLREDRRHSGRVAARRERAVAPVLIFRKGRSRRSPPTGRDRRANGEVPADRSVRERVHARLPRLGAEVRTRLAGLPDGAGVELLENHRRHVGLYARISRRCSTACSRRCSANKTIRATRATRTASLPTAARAGRSAIPA